MPHKLSLAALCLLLAALLCLLCACAPGPHTSQAAPAATAPSQAAEDAKPNSVTQGDGLAATVQEMEERIDANHALIKTFEAALKEQLGERTLKQNERYCFFFEGAYLVASGCGTPITDLNELKQCYPTWNVPAEIEGYTFRRAVITANDSPTFYKSSKVPQGMEENTISTFALSVGAIFNLYLEYGNGKEVLSVEALSPEESFLRGFPMENTEAKERVYALLESGEVKLPFLQWQESGLYWRLHGSDPALPLKELAEQDIGKALMLADAAAEGALT